MDRDILFEKLDNPQDIFFLKDHLRELYRLLDKRHIALDFSATPTFDADLADSYEITLTANITGVTIKNPYIGRVITLVFIQGNLGSYTIVWTTAVKLTGAAFVPTITIGAASAITLLYNGTVWREIGRALDVR